MKIPLKHPKIPKYAQRLGGVGSGSWFSLLSLQEPGHFRIKRWSNGGELECDTTLVEHDSYGSSLVHPQLSKQLQKQTDTHYIPFDPKSPYTFTYPSHCKRCTLLQNNRLYVLSG